MEDVAKPAAQVGGGEAVPAAAVLQGGGGEGEAEEQQEIHEGGWADEEEGEEEEDGDNSEEEEDDDSREKEDDDSEEEEESAEMHADLLRAATSGDSGSMMAMVQHSQDPSILLGTTPSGNTCLHISSIHGHHNFCQDAITQEESLLTKTNLDGETPLVVAVTLGHTSLASLLLGRCRELGLKKAILQQDRHGFNALHHATRSGHRKLAMELIAGEPALSKAVNKYGESPMFIAVMRNFTHIFEELLKIPDSSHAGPHDQNALHAAAINGDGGSARKIVGIRPEMARKTDKDGNTPLALAVVYNRTEVVRILLRHDRSLGYEVSKGCPLLHCAAYRGHVDVAREILKNCPDAPYRNSNEKCWTCLHTAVHRNHTGFVEFILTMPQLRKLINMQDHQGETALHFAVQRCNPKIVAALLSHEDIDPTIVAANGCPAAWELSDHATTLAKTLNWNEVSMRMLRAVPQQATDLYNLLKSTKQKATDASRKDAKSLTQTYTSNTSLVAILITTITFAAAFTLPGGYNNAAGSEGLPVMSKNAAFKAFLISDVLAMCSSFAVAFICIIARWGDYEFLLYYRSFTKTLMWFAYVATTTAFSTGLYTVVATHLHWLAIAICSLVAFLPIITWLLGNWPVLKLRIRLGRSFKSDLLDMV